MKHSTTLVLSGLLLRCECGNESVSIGHSNTACVIANFTVIRKGTGPIRRLEDEKVTPQCVLCEMYPATTRGYASHLKKHHKSNLKENGIYLLCACGYEVVTEHLRNHSKDCDCRQFVLHKLIEKAPTTPQCVKCEAYPTTARGYASHLRAHHKSTLNENAIYLLCSCGQEIRADNCRNHSKECDGRKFTLHKLIGK